MANKLEPSRIYDTIATIELAIEARWQVDSPLMQWNAMEGVLRSILKRVQAESISHMHAIALIDEAIAAFTRRGNEIKPDAEKFV